MMMRFSNPMFIRPMEILLSSMEASSLATNTDTVSYTHLPQPVTDYGRIQPQAPELEEAVLGALMIEKDAYSLVSEILRPESFYAVSYTHLNTSSSYKSSLNWSIVSSPLLSELSKASRTEVSHSSRPDSPFTPLYLSLIHIFVHQVASHSHAHQQPCLHEQMASGVSRS